MKMKIEDVRRGGAATLSHHLTLVYLGRKKGGVARAELGFPIPLLEMLEYALKDSYFHSSAVGIVL